MIMQNSWRNAHNERRRLRSILCVLLLVVICGSIVAENYYSLELLDEQIGLYKDTKVKIEDKKLESKFEKVYVDLHSSCMVKADVCPTGLICLHGLATFDRYANIGCFNKFIMRHLAVCK